MTLELKNKLQALAQKYEVASFTAADPSQFLRWYVENEEVLPTDAAQPSQPQPSSTRSTAVPLRLRAGATIADVECASFIAAMLAFGNRKQFIPKIKEILTTADRSGSITTWLRAGAPDFPHGPAKFYRFYSYDDMHCLFTELAQILQQAPTIGEYMKGNAFPSSDQLRQKLPLEGVREGNAFPSSNQLRQKLPLEGVREGNAFPWLQPAAPSSATPSSGVPQTAADSTAHTNSCTQPAPTPQRPATPKSQPALPLDQLVSQAFPTAAIVPKGKNSANKRIHMFLRWMVRTNSPVDLGIWSWYPQSELLIPLDVHVMEEGINLGLLPPNAKATRKTAVELSEKLSQAFPGDPTRGDFALFGLGVDKEK